MKSIPASHFLIGTFPSSNRFAHTVTKSSTPLNQCPAGMSAAMRNFAQRNAWQTISHCVIKLAIYQSGVSLLYTSDSCTYGTSHSIAFMPPLTVTRSSQASCINRHVLIPLQGPKLLGIYDETSRRWANSAI